VNAVAAGAPPHHHDKITRDHTLLALVARDKTDIAAVDQRIAEVAFVEIDRSVRGRNAHAVAVIAHPGNDALHHPFGMKDAPGQLVMGQIDGAETKDVGIDDRLGPEPRPHRIADHSADAGIGAAVGLHRRGMIVGFDLEADVIFVVKFDDAGIILKDRYAPGEVQLPGDAEDGLLERVVDHPALELDQAGEGLVTAVFGPGLGDHFKLDIGRLALKRPEIGLDGLHLDQIEEKIALAADLHQLLVRSVQQGDVDQLKRELLSWKKEPLAGKIEVFNHLVHQQLLSDEFLIRIRETAGELVTPCGPDRLDGVQAEVDGPLAGRFGNHVGDAAVEGHLGRPVLTAAALQQGVDGVIIGDSIGQQFNGNELLPGGGELTEKVIDPEGVDRGEARNTEIARAGEDSLPLGIVILLFLGKFNSGDHISSSVDD